MTYTHLIWLTVATSLMIKMTGYSIVVSKAFYYYISGIANAKGVFVSVYPNYLELYHIKVCLE